MPINLDFWISLTFVWWVFLRANIFCALTKILKEGGSNCLLSNVSGQNLAVSRRQWPKLGWELMSVWPKLTSTRSQILVTDVYSRPNSGHWRYLTTKFWPLTLEIRQLQRCFKEDSRVWKKVSSVFQEKFIKSFKGVSRIFQWSFVLPFCCSMNLIAATRAEGGLVFEGFPTEGLRDSHITKISCLLPYSFLNPKGPPVWLCVPILRVFY